MKKYITQKELEALNLSKLDNSTPFSIGGVSHSQLSISRFCGGCKFQGQNYLYIQTTDELIRDDVVKWLAKHRKEQKKTGDSTTAIQADLLTDKMRII
jgi:heterodisulfide reductase subunit B